MPKRRAKRTVKKPASPPPSLNVDDAEHAHPVDPPIKRKEDSARHQEFEREIAAIRAMRDMDTERLLTGLRLFRSYLKPEQLETPLLQFCKENLPNLSIVKSGESGHYEVKWKDEDNLLANQDGERNVQASILHQMFKTYSDCSAPGPSLGRRFEFSSKAVKARILGADNMQIKDFVLEEPSESAMLGLQEAFQTPGANSQRLSVGMTPKTLRLPKYGEMLLSVHGSPLGVYKEDNMEAIRETEETS